MNLLPRAASILLSSIISIGVTFLFFTFYFKHEAINLEKPSYSNRNVIDFVKEYQESVLHIGIKTQGIKEIAYEGTGFVFSYKNKEYVLTNEHVIAQADSIYGNFNNNKDFPLTLVGKDYDMDIAVLEFKDNKQHLPHPLALGDSSKVQIGENVIAIGYPLDAGFSVTSGIVSAEDKTFYIENRLYKDLIQTDAAVNPGNSGGPLIDENGEVIGVNTAVSENSQGIAFSIPVSKVEKVLDPLIRNGYLDHPFIGADLMNTNNGIRILSVLPNSPAEQAGLKTNDILLNLNHVKLTNTNDLKIKLNLLSIGNNANFIVDRDGAEKSLTVIVGNRKAVDSGIV